MIRAVRPGELAELRAIERAAGAAFRGIGMSEIADDEPFPVEVLDGYRTSGRAWVHADDADRPVAYLLADVVDGGFHIEQVSVRPTHGRRGLGRALIGYADAVARTGGYPVLTLMTFVDVPWNAPYYARLGFRAVADDDLTPGLLALRRHEAELGLDRWPRTCMRRPVSRPAPGAAPGGPAPPGWLPSRRET